jgi:protein SCO1
MTRNRRSLATLTTAGLLLLAAACDGGRSKAVSELRGVKRVPPSAKIDFTLNDTEGKPFRFKTDTHGAVTLLYFGYMNCPDVCPLHLANIAAALKQMTPEDQALVRVVFVTTDPNRDTPELLRGWLNNFDRRFIGLRGPLDSINAIQARMGLPPATMEMIPMDHSKMAGPVSTYGMGHAAQVLAFSADDSLRTEYPNGFKTDDWLNDLPRLARIR